MSQLILSPIEPQKNVIIQKVTNLNFSSQVRKQFKVLTVSFWAITLLLPKW